MKPVPNDGAIGGRSNPSLDDQHGSSKMDSVENILLKRSTRNSHCCKLSMFVRKSRKNCKQILVKRKCPSCTETTINILDMASKIISHPTLTKLLAVSRWRNHLSETILLGNDAVESACNVDRTAGCPNNPNLSRDEVDGCIRRSLCNESRCRSCGQPKTGASYAATDVEVDSAKNGSEIRMPTSANTLIRVIVEEFSKRCSKMTTYLSGSGGFEINKTRVSVNDGAIEVDADSAQDGSDAKSKTTAGTSLQANGGEFSTVCIKCMSDSHEGSAIQEPGASFSANDRAAKTDDSANDGSETKPKTSAGASSRTDDARCPTKFTTLCNKCATTMPPTKPGIFAKGGVKLRRKKRFNKDEAFKKLCKKTVFKPRRSDSGEDRKSLYRREIEPKTKRRIKKYLNKSVENLVQKRKYTNSNKK